VPVIILQDYPLVLFLKFLFLISFKRVESDVCALCSRECEHVLSECEHQGLYILTESEQSRRDVCAQTPLRF
jgi:hypothetical protein